MSMNLLSEFFKPKIIKVNTCLFFQVLIFFIILNTLSIGSVEIYSGGVHFSSFENYQNKIKHKLQEFDLQENETTPRQLIQRVSTLDQTKINQISFDQGIQNSLIKFKTWNKVRFIDMIDRDQLESTFRETIGKYHQPALVISESGKLRILSFDADSKIDLLNN